MRVNLGRFVQVGVDEDGIAKFRPPEWFDWTDEQRAAYDRSEELQVRGDFLDNVGDVEAARAAWREADDFWEQLVIAENVTVPRRPRSRGAGRPAGGTRRRAVRTSSSSSDDDPAPGSSSPAAWVDAALILARPITKVVRP